MEVVFVSQDERTTWRTWVDGLKVRLRGTNIPADIDPTRGKSILSQLDDIYGDVRPKYGDVLKQYKKTESYIERLKYKGQAHGSNPDARKANGIVAVETVELGNGTIVNLYDVFDILIEQKEDLEALLDLIKQKQSMVITMSGLLKIESNIAGH